MCYHRLYIFTTCGHSCYATYPILPCAAARAQPRHAPTSTPASEPTKPPPAARVPSAPPSPPRSPPSIPLFPDSPSTSKDRDPANHCPGPQFHPIQTLRLPRLCAVCTRRRDALLAQAESARVVRFEDWRWKVKYQSPSRVELTENAWRDRYGASAGEVLGTWVGGWGGDGGAGGRGGSSGSGKGAGRWLEALREVAASPSPAPAAARKEGDVMRVGFRGGIGSS